LAQYAANSAAVNSLPLSLLVRNTRSLRPHSSAAA
jgi:hypothetical protein